LLLPAVVTAGDRRAAKAVHGESKVYLEMGGLPLIAHVVLALQQVPEVSEVWVVGNAERLAAVLGSEAVRRELRKPLHVVPQFRNLYENAWQTYRRLLPGAGAEGRDPEPSDLDRWVLFLSGDLPFARPEEISSFVQAGIAQDVDYSVGLVTEESLAAFYPKAPGEPGIRMAYFNTAEGRFRQSNLHLVKPARIVNRHYVEELYEHRYQKEFGNIVRLAWKLLRSEQGGARLLFYYVLMHLAAIADRRGWRALADRLRRGLPIQRVEATLSQLLRTRLRFAVTTLGGCGVDIDNEHDFDAASLRYDEWRAAQEARALALHGRLPLPPAAGDVKLIVHAEGARDEP
jgi:molybdopterin-guanine dinucleotide biosynthesis protein A